MRNGKETILEGVTSIFPNLNGILVNAYTEQGEDISRQIDYYELSKDSFFNLGIKY